MPVFYHTYKAVSGSTDPAITAALAVVLAASVILLILVIIELRNWK